MPESGVEPEMASVYSLDIASKPTEVTKAVKAAWQSLPANKKAEYKQRAEDEKKTAAGGGEGSSVGAGASS